MPRSAREAPCCCPIPDSFTARATRCLAITIVAIGCLGFTGGCASRSAAETPLVVDPAEAPTLAKMNREQKDEITGAFADLADRHSASAVPAVATSSRGRWEDVRIAALYACDEVEMAIVSSREAAGSWEFRLRTVEDWPGTLTIRRVGGERVYETSATIGVFDDRTERAAALIIAFEKQMAAFGLKKQFSAG